jgi:hypothetical protein
MMRLHLRTGASRDERRDGGQETHKQTHRGTLRRQDGRVNRGKHESTRLHGAHMADGEIREIWSLVPTGARIVIRP